MTARRYPPSSQHPAVQAWSQICPNTSALNFIEILQEVRKGNAHSCVYRLDGVGHNGAPVIAKRCTARYAHLERSIYEEILPHLPVSSLIFYGCVDQPETEYSWLFLEDASGEEFAHSVDQHRRLAAHWLARMHVGAARVPAASRLPDRGPTHYLDHLRSTRTLVEDHIGDPALKPRDVQVLETVLSQGYLIESRWNTIEQQCDRFPRTLVHGDFARYNLRVRLNGRGIDLVAFDWEMAGFGVPAPDIAECSGRGVPRRRLSGDLRDSELLEYWSIVRESWPGLDWGSITDLADLGAIFRLIAAISWESESIRRGYWPIRELHSYEVDLAAVLHHIGWIDSSV